MKYLINKKNSLLLCAYSSLCTTLNDAWRRSIGGQHDVFCQRTHVAVGIQQPLRKLLECAIFYHLAHTEELEDLIKIRMIAFREVGRVAGRNFQKLALSSIYMIYLIES